MKRQMGATMMVAGLMALACEAGEPTATGIVARQRASSGGLVDVAVTFDGASNDVARAVCLFTATYGEPGNVLTLASISSQGEPSGSGTTWTRRFLWNAAADVGQVKVTDLALAVETKMTGGVQLWKDGPYWAECNVGAAKAEESGYFFWWGDTVGYTREGGTLTPNVGYSDVTWVSSAGARMSASPFDSNTCPTYKKSFEDLQALGYVDGTGDLAAAHDAATAHLGASWRMPTRTDVESLASECTATWITTNGVKGRLVTGKGEYAAKSIFIPAAGYGFGTDLWLPDVNGYGWSSSESEFEIKYAWYLSFDNSKFGLYGNPRSYGCPVRAVRTGRVSSAETTLAVDCRVTDPEVTDVPVPYSWIDKYYPDTENYELTALAPAANGVNTVQEAYVAGLDPTNETSVFKANVAVSNGMVYVSWEPNMNVEGVARIYTRYGRMDLDKGDWETPVKDGDRFFMVKVRLPENSGDDETDESGKEVVPVAEP